MLTIFFSVILVESCLFNMVILNQTQDLATAYDSPEFANLLNDDLKKISEWAFKWKMLFNPDITKQAQEVKTLHCLS